MYLNLYFSVFNREQTKIKIDIINVRTIYLNLYFGIFNRDVYFRIKETNKIENRHDKRKELSTSTCISVLSTQIKIPIPQLSNSQENYSST